MQRSRIQEGPYQIATCVVQHPSRKQVTPPRAIVDAAALVTRSKEPRPSGHVPRQHWTVAVLADGSRAPEAWRAAWGATGIAFRHLVDAIDAHIGNLDRSSLEVMVATAFAEARKDLESTAYWNQKSIYDYATSLLVIAANPVAGACVAQLGDGAILHGPPWQLAVDRERRSETAHFLTDDDALQHVAVRWIDAPVLNVVALTDTLRDAIAGPRSPLLTTLANSSASRPDLATLLRDTEAIGRKSEDIALIHLTIPHNLRPPALRAR